MEGLQGEEPEEQKDPGQQEGGVDMEDDFEGAVGDLAPDPEEQEEDGSAGEEEG